VPSDTLGVINAAVAKTEATSSASLAIEMKMNIEGHTAKFIGDGVQDFKATKAILNLHGEIDGTDISIEERVIGAVVYIKSDALPGADAKPWLKMDLVALSKKRGFDISQLQQYKQSDPSQMLKYLSGVSGEVKVVGHDTLHGVECIHYSGSVDPKKAGAGLSASQRAAFEAATSSTPMPMDVWIDGAGLARRIAMELDLGDALRKSGQSQITEMTMRIQFDYVKFGVPVHVEAPPFADVRDMGELTGS
jgi:hypothetical protein